TLAQLRLQMAEQLAQTPQPAPEDQLAMITLADGWRRPERFEQLLLACQATGMDKATGAALQRAYAAAAKVEARELMAKGFKGKALGEAIHQQRLERISQLQG
ncbi:MAG: multifunctional CCA tRNA nucleotidyl transferase/2'3'-cyclic phosphodiesterase/2'nucleotidase/phosphatase, partial [Halomonadaceae bacterium]